jgi:hypothetical protein
MNPFIGSLDHVDAMLHWSFQELPEVVELTSQLHAGMICPVDYSRQILLLWDQHGGEL